MGGWIEEGKRAGMRERVRFWKLALRHRERIVMPALVFLTLSVYLIGNAGKRFVSLYQEKSQPCRLSAFAAVISDSDAAVVGSWDLVEACTVVYPVEAKVTAAGYEANLTLYGVDSRFLSQPVKEGMEYPDSTVMPYLLVSQSALAQLKGAGGEAVDDIQSVDWLTAPVSLDLGGTVITGKICGILETQTEGEKPAVYISQESAKGLVRQAGKIPSAGMLWLKIRNAGAEETVTAMLADMGYRVESGNQSRYQGWEVRQAQGAGLLLAGVISLAGAIAVLFLRIQLDALRHGAEYERLQQREGCRGNVRNAMNRVRILYLLGCGMAAGALLVWIGPVLAALAE